MAETCIRLPKMHAGQARLFAGRRRFNVGRCGRRYGKTTLGTRLSIEPALHGLPVGWFAPSYKLLDDAWSQVLRRVRTIVTRKDQQARRLELATGGSLDFWTLLDEDAGRGRKYARVIIDEAAMARKLEKAWTEAIRPTLTDLRGDAWLFSTPKRTRQDGARYFRKLCDRAAIDPDWNHFTAPSWENPYLPPDEIEQARRDLPELVFRQEYGAEFVDLDSILMREELLRYVDQPFGEIVSIAMGVDLAISTADSADWTACAVMCRNLQGDRFVLDVQRERVGFRGACDFIARMADKWKPSAIAVETVQYQAAVVEELLRNTALPVRGVTPEKDKVARFMPLVNRYEKGLVFHVRGLPGAFEEELLAFPEGEYLDQVDALVYADLALGDASSGGYAVAGSRTY